jgi:hypothetical protein
VSASSSRAATPPLTPASQHGGGHSRSRSSSTAITTTTASGESQQSGDADSDVSAGSETSPTSTLHTRQHRSRGSVTLSHKSSFSGHRSGGVSPLALRNSSNSNSSSSASSSNSSGVRVVRTGSVAKLSSGLRNGSVSGAAGSVGPPRAKRKVTRRNCFFEHA